MVVVILLNVDEIWCYYFPLRVFENLFIHVLE